MTDYAGQILQSVLNKTKDALKVDGNNSIDVNITSKRNEYPIAAYVEDGKFNALVFDVEGTLKIARMIEVK